MSTPTNRTRWGTSRGTGSQLDDYDIRVGAGIALTESEIRHRAFEARRYRPERFGPLDGEALLEYAESLEPAQLSRLKETHGRQLAAAASAHRAALAQGNQAMTEYVLNNCDAYRAKHLLGEHKIELFQKMEGETITQAARQTFAG
jgi:hypothetical protein